jgi:hypothetical protein
MDNDNDNVIDMRSKKEKKKEQASQEEPSTKNMYYEVSPLVGVKEAERLIKMKYMTDTGYLDLLGLLNEIQANNLKKMNRVLWTSMLLSATITVAILAFFILR